MRAIVLLFLLVSATGISLHSGRAASHFTLNSDSVVARRETGSSPAQTATTIAKPGEPILNEIKGAEVQTFRVLLASGQYMQVKFVWQGIDLDVSILTPEGKPSLTSKIPVRASGTPDITIIAEVSGHYILEVRPSENLNVTGRYAMTLLAIRSPTPADQARASALKLLADANRQTLDETAIGKYLEALSRYREAADVFGEACTLRQLGRRQASLKDLPAAEKTYRLAIELTEKLNDAPTLAYGLRDIGSDYRDFDSPQKALVYYQRALQIFRDVGDRRGEAAALYSNGFAEARIGHMQVATKCMSRR